MGTGVCDDSQKVKDLYTSYKILVETGNAGELLVGQFFVETRACSTKFFRSEGTVLVLTCTQGTPLERESL